MTKYLFLLFSLSLSQNIIWKANVTLNKYGWIPWDYASGILIYHSNGIEYKCLSSSTSCTSVPTSYIPNAYAILSYESFFYNDDTKEETCSVVSSSTICFRFIDTQYIKQFESISVLGSAVFVKCPEISTIGIYQYPSNQIYKRFIINNNDTRWQIKDTLYSFKVDQNGIRAVKYSTDLNRILWTQSLPYCKPKNPNNELFVSVLQPFVFIICSSANLIFKLDSQTGSHKAEYSLDIGDVKDIQCSFDFLFILYGNGYIVQYTQDFNYVYTYAVENIKMPRYNSLRVDKNYIFSLFCTGNFSTSDCPLPVLYQLSVQQKITKPLVDFSNQISADPSVLDLTFSTSAQYTATPFLLPNIDELGFTENYNFSPDIYRDKDNKQHIIYFSGGGNAGKGYCGDVFLHDITILRSLNADIPITGETLLYQKRLVSGAPNYPISDYAAAIIKIEQMIIYIIHGGVSCDYKRVYSDMFAIDVFSLMFIKIEQNLILE
jgi:hypothetical protein